VCLQTAHWPADSHGILVCLQKAHRPADSSGILVCLKTAHWPADSHGVALQTAAHDALCFASLCFASLCNCQVLDMFLTMMFFFFGPDCWCEELILVHGLLHATYSLDLTKIGGCLSVLQRLISTTTPRINPPGDIPYCSGCNYHCTLAMAAVAANAAHFYCAACGPTNTQLYLLEGNLGQAIMLQQLILHLFHTSRLCWINLPSNLSIPNKVRLCIMNGIC
jgi:hypothetical protein